MTRKPFKSFIRTKEDFTCGHCGTGVKGTGFTNHCPACLWSRHVDVNPGDRASTCGGMMEPISAEPERDGYIITHRCMKCGHEKRNTASSEDDFEKIVGLIRSVRKTKKK